MIGGTSCFMIPARVSIDGFIDCIEFEDEDNVQKADIKKTV